MKSSNYFFSLFVFFLSLSVFGQTSIYDLQFTEDPYGVSLYEGQTVTVTGIVTSSAKEFDLGFTFIQDKGGGPWSGIWIDGGGVNELYRNEEVTVTGEVIEYQGITVLSITSYELTGLLKDVVISEVDPSDSAAYLNNGMEKWESCLIMYKAPGGEKIYISHPKTNPLNDFGDYAVSPVLKSVAKKTGLILAGRLTSSLISSLFVQIVSDSAWWDNSGQMQVNPIEASTEMTMDGVIGIMTYGFGDYRLLPRNNDDFVDINVELEPTFLPGSPLSIHESTKPEVKVFPNPASEYFQISSINGTFMNLKLFNLNGKVVLHKDFHSEDQKVDVSDLSTGIYTVQLKSSDGTSFSKQIMIQ